jgi:hypothetical protein
MITHSTMFSTFLPFQTADYELKSPANAQHNWCTGMCLVSDPCTQADFLPRNTSIWYNLIAPELTDNQERAVKALNATGTPEFWIAAAHANGVYDQDAEIAQAAAASSLRHRRRLHRAVRHFRRVQVDVPRRDEFSGDSCFAHHEPAQRFGYATHSGRIAKGLEADLVVLRADPAQNTSAFQKFATPSDVGRSSTQRNEIPSPQPMCTAGSPSVIFG